MLIVWADGKIVLQFLQKKTKIFRSQNKKPVDKPVSLFSFQSLQKKIRRRIRLMKGLHFFHKHFLLWKSQNHIKEWSKWELKGTKLKRHDLFWFFHLIDWKGGALFLDQLHRIAKQSYRNPT